MCVCVWERECVRKRERDIERAQARARANVSACMSTVGVFNEVFLEQLKGLDGCVCVRGR